MNQWETSPLLLEEKLSFRCTVFQVWDGKMQENLEFYALFYYKQPF